MYSARELQEAMSMTDEVDINDKRFSVHSINEEGKAVSLAEECARLLRIGRTEGVKSEGGKYKKREDSRGIHERHWWVEPVKDLDLTKLKYETATFSKRSKEAGGSSSFRYHVYCCPELGTGRVAMRRIPCACES